jgi:lysozyme
MNYKKIVFIIGSIVILSSIYFTKSKWYPLLKRYYIYYNRTTSRKDIVNDTKTAVWGIDLSHHQGNVNWDKLIKCKPHFIFCKVTEGNSHKDTKYSYYSAQARKNDIIMGAYHFFSYKSSGKLQANYFIKHSKLQKGDLPYVLDAEYEYKYQMPNQKVVTQELLSFLETVENKTGVRPIIYCEKEFYGKYLKDHVKKKYPLWICDFKRKPKTDYLFWQKTDNFKVDGIKGGVDFSVFNGNKLQLERLTIN